MSDKEFYEALAGLQHDIDTLPKNKSVDIGKFKFSYADLASIREAIREPLFKWGFSITQTMEDNVLITSLCHKSGECVKSYAKIPPSPDLKALGASLTYLRRYSIASLLNLVSDDDLDVLPEESTKATSSIKLVTPEEIETLNEVLDMCDPDYKKKVLDSLKSVYQITNMSQMSTELYRKVLKSARERSQ